MGQIKVFVSSTCYDLKQIRSDLFDFLTNMGYVPILSEYNSFPIDPRKDIRENCIENVKQNTDIFILIVGNRYGQKIDADKSITNTEYLYAKRLGIPIYVFIYKPIISLLPIWKKNGNADFSDTVDSPKIFEFVTELRDTNSNWCYEFDKAQDIIEACKIQFSHLFKISLDIQKKFSTNLPDFYEHLTPTAINILLDKDTIYEVLYFSQVLEDELNKYSEAKFLMEYQVLMGAKNRIDNNEDLSKWISKNMTSLIQYLQSATTLFGKALTNYFAEPNVPSDLKGLYYVAKTIGRLYNEMIQWSIDIKSTSVKIEFEPLRDNVCMYTLQSAENIWNFPKEMKAEIFEAKEKLKNGEIDQIHLKTTINFPIDEEYINSFYKEVERIKR